MGIFRNKNRKATRRGRGDDRGDQFAGGPDASLYLYLSDTEWQAQFLSPDGIPASSPMGEAFKIAKEDGKSFADSNEIILRALTEIGNSQIGNIGTVSIVLNDPGIALLDNLDSHFSSANVSKIRLYGAESLHCEEVSYGFSRFGAAEPPGTAAARSDQGVFGFVDIDVLRRYLGQMNRLAIKTVLIAPVTQNTIFDAQLQADKATCGVYMGARSTQVIVANAASGSVTTRKLPIGLYSLVDAIAKANNVSIADALTALDRRDCVSQVLLDLNAGGQTGNQVPGQFERILGETVRALGDEIDRTLQYFDVQRMGGRPDAIKLYGPVASIKGLSGWLGKRLSVEIIDANETVLDDLVNRPRSEGLNLLEGAKSPLIRLGRVNYAWDKDRFLPEQELDSDEVAEERAASLIISGKTVAKSDAATAQPRLFRRAKGSDGTGRPNAARGRRQPDNSKQKNERAGFALMALFAFVFLYGGYKTFIVPKINEFNRLTNTYTGTLRQNVSLRTEKNQALAGNVVKRPTDSRQDKVLWTEKFLALGCYATKAIWLTDVYLTTTSTTANGKPQKTQKLTIKGAVLPSTDGHLLQISDYIRRLEEDRRGLFMGDFKRITFEGATIDYEDVEEIIRFTIEGWYDKDKRRAAEKAVRPDDLSMAGCLIPEAPKSSPRKEALLDTLPQEKIPGGTQ